MAAFSRGPRRPSPSVNDERGVIGSRRDFQDMYEGGGGGGWRARKKRREEELADGKSDPRVNRPGNETTSPIGKDGTMPAKPVTRVPTPRGATRPLLPLQASDRARVATTKPKPRFNAFVKKMGVLARSKKGK